MTIQLVESPAANPSRRRPAALAFMFSVLCALVLALLPAQRAQAQTALTLVAPSLPAAVVGTPYAQGLRATGGTGPYTWTVTGGGLPAGLTLISSGIIGGTPTVRGANTVTVTVTDSASPAAVATETFSVAVTSATVTDLAGTSTTGKDRFGTAAEISKAAYPATGSAFAVVLARADDYPDALVGAALAASKSAPVLFTRGGTLPTTTQAELQRAAKVGDTVYLLGGTAAIPESIATEVTSLGYNVVRYGGADRYATAVAVADALGDPTTVLLATGTGFADALAAGPAAAKAAGVVLLTEGSTMPAQTAAYLAAHPGKVYAVGGPAAAADLSATPIVGADRYLTATAVATQFFSSPTKVGVASGATFADALAGGALVAQSGNPLVLTDPITPSPSTAAYLTANEPTLTTVWIFGGTAAISKVVQTAVAVSAGQ